MNLPIGWQLTNSNIVLKQNCLHYDSTARDNFGDSELVNVHTLYEIRNELVFIKFFRIIYLPMIHEMADVKYRKLLCQLSVTAVECNQ